jgi:hypothetical protein
LSSFQHILDLATSGLPAVMRDRLARHILAQIVCLGTHSVTSLLSSSGRLALDWSADYRMYSRQRIEPDALFASVRRNLLDHLPEDSPAVVALDDTRLRKSGRKVSGAKYARDPLGPRFQVNFIWAQRFVQLSMATAGDAHTRMVPIAWRHAPTPPKPASKASSDDHQLYRQACRQAALGAVAGRELAHLRSWMDSHGQAGRLLCSVVDGGYTNQTLLKNLPPQTVVIGRIRADAKLYHLPESQPANGRHRLYGALAHTPEQLRQDDSVAWQTIPVWIGGQQHELRIKTLGPLRWRSAGGGHSLRLVVLAPLRYRQTPAGKLLYRSPAYLICTDFNEDPREIVQRYVHRWDIENNFREEKTLLGVGEAQVREEHAVENVTGVAVAAYAMLLAASRNLDPSRDLTLPNPRWNRRPRPRVTTRQLIQQMRQDLWGEALSFSGFASTKAAARSPGNDLSNPYHSVMHASRFS